MRSTRFSILFIGMIFIVACTDSMEEVSPFDQVLSQPPFKSLTDSIKQNSSDPGLYFRRAQLLRKHNLPEAALADYKKAWSLNKREQYAVGISNIFLEHRPDSASAFLVDALKVLPSNLFLQLNLVQAYMQQGKTDDALKVCNDILQKEPSQIDALMMKSDLLYKKNDITGSIATLEKAYQLAPFDAELAYKLAFKYAENKNYKAITLSDSLIKMDRTGSEAEPYYFKGVYFSNTGERSKALKQFNQSIQRDYNFLNAYLQKGIVLYDQKKYAEAMKVFQLAITITPSFADAYYWTGKCQEALNLKEEAKLNYLRAYGLDKSLTEAKEAADRIES